MEINSDKLSGHQLALEALVTGMQIDADEHNSTLLQEAASEVEDASNALVQAVCKLESWEDEAERAEKDEPINEPDEDDAVEDPDN